MNKVILMGRLTDEPKVSRGANDLVVARYSLAVPRTSKNKEGKYDSDFINCVAFNKAGEFAEKYMHKGQRFLVSGEIRTGSYINKEDKKIYTTDVLINSQEFADAKKEGNVAEGFSDIPQDTDDILFGE